MTGHEAPHVERPDGSRAVPHQQKSTALRLRKRERLEQKASRHRLEGKRDDCSEQGDERKMKGRGKKDERKRNGR